VLLDDWASLGLLDGSRMYGHGNDPWTAAFSTSVGEVARFFLISTPSYTRSVWIRLTINAVKRDDIDDKFDSLQHYNHCHPPLATSFLRHTD
jgi:hypothetical protein